MNRHEDLVDSNFPAEPSHMTRMAGDAVPIRGTKENTMLEVIKNSLNNMSGRPTADRPAHILEFPSGTVRPNPESK